ncbi:MAG: altronate dehydratase [Acidobacteria bacterium]|nr:altronate dehydratase [Acidobacteriota bacterium]
MSTTSSQLDPLSAYAIQVDPRDNVAVAKLPVPRGTAVQVGATSVEVLDDITPGHRFALSAIPAGEFVRQYAQPIGTSTGVLQGALISRANMSNDVPVVRELADDLHTSAPDYLPEAQRATFMGYRRADGRVGIRNWILIVPTSMCAAHEAVQIATVAEFTLFDKVKYPNVDGVVAIPHNKGCGCSDGSNIEVMLRTLAAYAEHPNVGAVVFIGLGCEKTNLTVMEKYLSDLDRPLNKPVARVGIQEAGGTQGSVKRGLEAVEAMLPVANQITRTPSPISALSMGVKCGGSDGFSGLSANPALGRAADELVRQGGTVLITEVPEFCGAEHILASRAKDAETGRAVYEMVDWYKEYASKFGTVLNENPSPGNVAGGLLNITIKSLGAIAKAGTTRVEGVVGYAERPSGHGLYLMQGPGYDQESTPGLIASGAQVVVFTTGRGTTIGNAIAPVLKLASNNAIFERMKSDLDMSAGDVIDGTASIDDVGLEVFEYVRRVASGEVVGKAEENKHREFQVWAEQSVSL